MLNSNCEVSDEVRYDFIDVLFYEQVSFFMCKTSKEYFVSYLVPAMNLENEK